jgi:hypothetical protein
MATPNASANKNLDVAFELMVLALKTPQTSYAYKQLLLLILSTVQAAVVESSPHPSFYNAFESSGGPSDNPEVQDDGENEGEDGEDTGEDTREDTHQLVGCPRYWYSFLPTMHPYCDAIPHVRGSDVIPYIMIRLSQMLNGKVNVYKVERVWFNHGSDGWNVVFTFERSPLNHAYPIRFKEGWMKVGHLHIKESHS